MVQPVPVLHVDCRNHNCGGRSPGRLCILFPRHEQPAFGNAIRQSRIRERRDRGERHPMVDWTGAQLRLDSRHHRHHRNLVRHLLHHIHHHRLDRPKNRNQRHRPIQRNTGKRPTQSRNRRTIRRLRAASRILITRLASGLPVGSDLEYADEITFGRALAGRSEA